MYFLKDHKKLIFIDCETVRNYAFYTQEHLESSLGRKIKKTESKLVFELDDNRGWNLFEAKRISYQRWHDEDKELSPIEFYCSRCGLWAEYGKVVTVTLAVYDDKEEKFRYKQLASHNERELLIELTQILNAKKFYEYLEVSYKDRMEQDLNSYSESEVTINTMKGDKTYYKKDNKWQEVRQTYFLCGHNIDRFDRPYIYKRCVTNKIMPSPMLGHPLDPRYLDDTIDTMKVFNHQSSNGNATLDVICHLFGLGSSKGGAVKGIEVSDCYYNLGKFSNQKGDEGLTKINNYCKDDVVETVNMVLVYNTKLEVVKPLEAVEAN